MIRRTVESAFTLIEVLVSLGITGIVFVGAISFYSSVSLQARDRSIMTDARMGALSVISLLSSELQFAGAGVPFYQPDFSPGTAGLGDAPLAVLTTSNTTRISFRAARRGAIGIISSNYTPSNSQRSFSVTSSAGFLVGDTIYISNVPRAGNGALSGVIRSISGTTITISTGFIASPGVIFEAGSVVHPVETITYESTPGLGISRTDASSTLNLASNATFSLQYMNRTFLAIPLPLTLLSSGSQLAAIKINLTLSPVQRLRLNPGYQVQLQRTVALRNLLIGG